MMLQMFANRGKGCPFCAGKRVLKGVNDLSSQYPKVVSKFWDFSKNSISPDKVYKFSGKKFYWKCKECGYEWENAVSNLTRNGYGCPACAGNVAIIGINDF